MRGVPAWALKGSAVCLTVVATCTAASYVGGHVKDRAAPLRPSLHPDTGTVALGPAVRGTTSAPVTETHAS
ncbi:MAG: hypothetical protein E6J41_21610 [Chloroflexi bacterium]|nr:MAG: hypothetical protein E6J41_21610 [Chloroflexota bacterium]